jgi:hypothetical protein
VCLSQRGRGNEIGAAKFRRTLAVVLPHCVHLQELWLGRNSLGDGGVSTLVSAVLPRLSSLRVLDLSGNGIGPLLLLCAIQPAVPLTQPACLSIYLSICLSVCLVLA